MHALRQKDPDMVKTQELGIFVTGIYIESFKWYILEDFSIKIIKVFKSVH